MIIEFSDIDVIDDLHKIFCFRMVGTRMVAADRVRRKSGKSMNRQCF